MPSNTFLRRCIFNLLMAWLLLIMPTSCFRHYYRIAKQPINISPGVIDSLQKQSRYFILRSGDYAWHMKNISLSNDQKTIQCELADLPFEHQLHLKKGEHHQNMQYKKKEPTRSVLNEVHFYIAPEPMTKDGLFTLPADKIQKIEIIEKNGGRTVASYIGGTFGVLGGIAGAAMIIAVLTSCPFVSPYDGKEFSLQGEIYGGAVYPQLARNDYIKLNMAPTRNGKLQLKISNELKEVQHTDVAELITITHSKDVTILSDQDGNIYSIKNALPPISALNNNNVNVTDLLAAKDGRIMEMNDSTPENTVILHFNKPSNASKGKLVLNVKNTFWLDRLYGKMLQGFGSYYNTFVASQKNKTAEELNKWTEEQKIPLAISIKTKQGWKRVTGLKTSGPVAFRDVVVPIDLSNVNEPFAEIAISSGFMFWDLDYAAMDYSDDEIFNTERQRPVMATDETGNKVTNELSNADGNYLIQPAPGNVTTITYNYHKPSPGQAQTYILHSKGWYETIRNFQGHPDVTFLQQFKKAGAFPRFSLDLYRKEQAVSETTAKK